MAGKYSWKPPPTHDWTAIRDQSNDRRHRGCPQRKLHLILDVVSVFRRSVAHTTARRCAHRPITLGRFARRHAESALYGFDGTDQRDNRVAYSNLAAHMDGRRRGDEITAHGFITSA